MFIATGYGVFTIRIANKAIVMPDAAELVTATGGIDAFLSLLRTVERSSFRARLCGRFLRLSRIRALFTVAPSCLKG